MNAFAGYISLNNTPVFPETIENMGYNLVGYQPDRSYTFGDSKARFVQIIRHNTPESLLDRPYSNFLHDVRLDTSIPAGKTDSQVVFKAFRTWGESCTEHLIGDYAFAHWNPESETLFAARDQIGQRVLYYTHQPGRFFAFATVISALLALPEVKRDLNSEKIHKFLNLDSPKQELTFYKRILRLRAGEQLTLSKNQLCLKRNLAYLNPKTIRFKKDSDYIEAFLEVFDTAVQNRLRSSFKIGAHLSGGLDSSSVVAMATRTHQNITTFSAFPETGYKGPTRPNWNLDDSHYVRSMKAMYPDLEPVFVHSENRDFFTGLDSSYKYLDAPCLNPCNRVWIHEIFEAAAGKNIRVMLGGAMGNATISWRGMTTKQRLGWWFRTPQRFVKPNRRVMKDPRRWMIADGVISDGLGYFQAERAFWGVEFRDPTHDQRLVEFCLGLPNHQFARDGMNRMLIRRAMKNLLPEIIRVRRDQGEQLSQWPSILNICHTRMQQEWGQFKISSTIRNFININQVEDLIESWPQSKVDSRKVLLDYRLTLLRSFFVARFVNWIEHGRRAEKNLGTT